jgi:hypothetical protein
LEEEEQEIGKGLGKVPRLPWSYQQTKRRSEHQQANGKVPLSLFLSLKKRFHLLNSLLIPPN